MDPEEAVAIAALDFDLPRPLSELCKETLRILVPTDVSNMLWMSSQTVTLIFVARNHGVMGAAQYSSGITIFNMCGFSFIQGFGAAIDTISSQAYGKDRRSPVVGETLQLALAFNLLLGVVISIFFFFSRPFAVLLLGEDIGGGTAEFLRWCPLYLFVQIISGVCSKSMFAQKIPGVVAVANLAAACSSPITNYFLTPLGLWGAALSLFITVGLCALTHIFCCVFHPRVTVRLAQWPTPQLRDLAAWRRFFEIGLPSVLATCAEWWAFEVQVVLAAGISPLALAVHGVCMNLVNLLFSVALGICVSASVIVGYSLGANRPRQARQFAYFILICDVAIGVVTAALMLIFGRDIAKVFADRDDKDYEAIIAGVHGMMPFVVLCHFGDSLQFCLQGVFRGAAQQKAAGIAVLATLWLIGVPASILFVKVLKTGVAGCVGGLLVGFVAEIPLLFYWMTKFDWPKLALMAQESLVQSEGALDVVMTVYDGPNNSGSGEFVKEMDPAPQEWSLAPGKERGVIDYPHKSCDEPLCLDECGPADAPHELDSSVKSSDSSG